MVPTPASLTSLTLMLALRLAFFQIVDQLCQILDGVDIVVGRGGDQPTPVVLWRVLAIHGYTLHRADCRPHRALRLCQLDLDLLALTRYLLVTPKRAEATCLILELLSLW